MSKQVVLLNITLKLPVMITDNQNQHTNTAANIWNSVVLRGLCVLPDLTWYRSCHWSVLLLSHQDRSKTKHTPEQEVPLSYSHFPTWRKTGDFNKTIEKQNSIKLLDDACFTKQRSSVNIHIQIFSATCQQEDEWNSPITDVHTHSYSITNNKHRTKYICCKTMRTRNTIQLI